MMIGIQKIETDKPMVDFGKLADLAFEWERDGLGTWMAFETPWAGQGPIIAAPKDELDKVGCSVFFQTAVNIDDATKIAQKLTEIYKLKNPRWMTSDGVRLVVR